MSTTGYPRCNRCGVMIWMQKRKRWFLESERLSNNTLSGDWERHDWGWYDVDFRFRGLP